MDILNLLPHKANGAIKRLILFFYKDAFPIFESSTDSSPEQEVLIPYCKGIGIDVGCGSKKTHPSAIGIDTTPKGMSGKYGSETRMISNADICLSGDNLGIFADGVFDYVVSRHNLEHYDNPSKVLREWKRVLKKKGILGVVLPDDEALNTIKLDPTHKHAFTKESFKKVMEEAGGFKILELKTCIPKWSFVCIAKKVN